MKNNKSQIQMYHSQKVSTNFKLVATIGQLIQEKLPEDVKMANATKDLITQLSLQFVTNLSAKANVACSQNKKKTICPEHVLEALNE